MTGVVPSRLVRVDQRVSLLALLAASLVPSCVESSGQGDSFESDAGGIFGGSLDPIGQDNPPEPANDVAGCSEVPPGKEEQIDNFEDANLSPFAEGGRVGLWNNSVLTLPEGESFAFEVLEGGADGSSFAGFVTASAGFAQGVSVLVGFGTTVDGVPCPYNAADFSGFSFYSKGRGRLQLKVSTSDIVSTEFGGTCLDLPIEQCWDRHTRTIPLSEDWTLREIRWDSLTQAGWGKAAEFNPRHFRDIIFELAPEELPTDFWIDEIRFLPVDPSSPTPAE